MTDKQSMSVSIVQSVNYPINPLVYGVNFPTSASYIKNLGVPLSRWGGNAVTAYNPFGGFTNAGSDWYFENRASDSADDWLGWVKGAGSASMLTVPAYVDISLEFLAFRKLAFLALIGCPKMHHLIPIHELNIQVCSTKHGNVHSNSRYHVRSKSVRSVQ